MCSFLCEKDPLILLVLREGKFVSDFDLSSKYVCFIDIIVGGEVVIKALDFVWMSDI